MIPGRVTRLVLNPTRAGFYRGVCAEYCGESHALMRFSVVVQEKDEFVRWLAAQAAVIVSTFSLAAQKRSMLWTFAAAAGLAAVGFAVYVYFYV